MQLLHTNIMIEIIDFLVEKTENQFRNLDGESTDEPIFRFNFFMIVRLHDAVLAIEKLLFNENHLPLIFSLFNTIRPILIDTVYSSSINKILNQKEINSEILTEAAKFIQEIQLENIKKNKVLCDKYFNNPRL